MAFSYFCQPAFVVHDSVQLGISKCFAERLSVTCAESQSSWDISQVLIQDVVLLKHLAVPPCSAALPRISQLHAEFNGSWQHFTRAEGRGIFATCARWELLPAVRSNSLSNSFIFHCWPFSWSAPCSWLCCAQGTQCRDSLDCFNCLKLITSVWII